MSHAIDGSVPYDLAGRLKSQEETKAWLEERTQAKECPSCEAATENWWSYCAMCGWHIASGLEP